MKLLPYSSLGAKECRDIPGRVHFGVFLPGIAAGEYEVDVRIIHCHDQFLQAIPTRDFPMTWSYHPDYPGYDYWSADVDILPGGKPHVSSQWGDSGQYIYRFRVRSQSNNQETDFISDPFAREFSRGKLSAFTLGYVDHEWSQEENSWKTPTLNDLIVYELSLAEFGGGLSGTRHLLDYVQDLGVNCLEILPVTNVSEVVDWGYLPLGYFGIDERYGNRKDFQLFVDEAHKRGIAVILDVVYGHTGYDFTYSHLYRLLKKQSPLNGSFAKDLFSHCADSTDFSREFTRDFFYTVNYQWLDIFHVDGFRYDCVPNYYEGPEGKGYAFLVYQTHQLVKSVQDGYWKRFHRDGEIALIQCAEQLDDPIEVLNKTYSNCTWQNITFNAAVKVASTGYELERLALHGFGLEGFPVLVEVNEDKIAKSAFQYIENHDHSRFICNFGCHSSDEHIFREGKRELWFKVQPYLIGLFTGKGIPLLWQGQEFCENYYLPESGTSRVRLLRPVRWDYFYDDIGRCTLGLIRKLIRIRKENSLFRTGEYFFYNNYLDYQSKRILIFHRKSAEGSALIALNFSDQEQIVPVAFPEAGNYKELLHNYNNLENVEPERSYWLRIPENYGRIWSNVR